MHLFLAATQTAAAAAKLNPQAAALQSLLPFILMFAIFYFLLIRPQQKQEKERKSMLSALHKGDDVITIGGVKGTITDFEEKGPDNYVVVRVADKVELRFLRSAINRVIKKD